jgi:hypothetical protein
VGGLLQAVKPMTAWPLGRVNVFRQKSHGFAAIVVAFVVVLDVEDDGSEGNFEADDDNVDVDEDVFVPLFISIFYYSI